jgi:hypothetical protein
MIWEGYRKSDRGLFWIVIPQCALVYGFYIDTAKYFACVALSENYKIIMNYELEKILKEEVVACFKLL